MKNYIFFVAFLFCSYVSTPQNPKKIQWQHSFGGSLPDYGSRILVDEPTGDIFFLGNSSSRDKEMTTPTGFSDLVLGRFDPNGRLLWRRNYGKRISSAERGRLSRTKDRGFIIAGSINNHCRTPFGLDGSTDIWVIKTDSIGNVQWERCYGGSSDDLIGNIYEMGDGNFIMVGGTQSSDGDITGNHGQSDAWIVKINNAGNIIWSRCYGGSYYDFCHDVISTSDNGFVVAGITLSNDGDISGNHSFNNDGFLTKFDKNGNVLWHYCYGGTQLDNFYGITKDSLGNFYTVGNSASRDGDVFGGNGGEDIWVVKFNSTGNLQWQKCIGGSRLDAGYSIKVAKDNSLLVCGYTGSSDNAFSSNYYKHAFWVGRLSETNGNVLELAFLGGTSSSDFANDVACARDGGILVVGSTTSSNPYVTDYKGSIYDAWLVKLATFNTIKGTLFLDQNLNGTRDIGEPLYKGGKIVIKKNASSDSIIVFGRNGNFIYYSDTGSYEASVQLADLYHTAVPAKHTSTFTSYFNVDSIGFAVQPIPGKKDLVVSMYPIDPARPGFDVRYVINLKNVGTQDIANSIIQLNSDSRLIYQNASVMPTSVNGNTVSWTNSILHVQDSASIIATYKISQPPAVNAGDTIQSTVLCEPMSGDETPFNNADTAKQLVTGSFDPNDKTETHGGVISPAQISAADPLTYIIRFQNLGTDTAFNITVRDTLDNRLDWASLEMIGASHGYNLTVDGNNKVTWTFNDVKLPHKAVNEPASHGYIVYRINPKTTVPLSDTIKNGAGIYFDFNQPVATNIEKTIVFMLTPLPVTLISFQALVNDAAVDVQWKTAIEENVSHFEVLRSVNGIDFIKIAVVEPGKGKYLYKDQEPFDGYNYYRLKTIDKDGATSYSGITLINMKRDENMITSIYPNPVNGRSVNLKIKGPVKGNIRIQLLDQLGRIFLTKQYNQAYSGEFRTELNLGELSKGSYLMKISTNDKVYINTILIQ